ncbi:hypothetical protein WJX72_011095 [[Myrmecia] bisecta]|uniref:Uncharacterized protein n=1 Tax=[Myrmecia] bisecta TaxID=41462 RepID=A0AAW1Q8D3_9CHLO
MDVARIFCARDLDDEEEDSIYTALWNTTSKQAEGVVVVLKMSDVHSYGMLRHSDPLRCPVGALARYLVYRNDIKKDGLISDLTAEVKNIVGQLKLGNIAAAETLLEVGAAWGKPLISTSVKYDDVIDLYVEAEVWNKEEKNFFRHIVARAGMAAGHTLMEVSLAMNLETPNHHVLQPGMLLTQAGFGKEYKLQRQGKAKDITENQKAKCFIGLGELQAACREMGQLLVDTPLSGGAEVQDIANTLEFLRQVYIEDAVILSPKFPDFPTYKGHPLFL